MLPTCRNRRRSEAYETDNYILNMLNQLPPTKELLKVSKFKNKFTPGDGTVFGIFFKGYYFKQTERKHCLKKDFKNNGICITKETYLFRCLVSLKNCIFSIIILREVLYLVCCYVCLKNRSAFTYNKSKGNTVPVPCLLPCLCW